MKRKGVVAELKRSGCVFIRKATHGELFRNEQNGKTSLVPCHTEIDRKAMLEIFKRLGLPKPNGRS